MYSQRRILERIESIQRRSPSWAPEYHTIAEVESFNRHVDSLQEYDAKGNPRQKREFTYDELAWIENEYNLCASDFRYWLERYAFINAKSEIVRFQLRHSQEMLLQLWAEREELLLGIEQIILKARQQGVSTAVELAITHRINFGFGVNAAVASSESDQAERMSGMMTLAYNQMPYWMQAPPTSNRAGSLFAFAGNSTRLSIYTGRSLGGLARGDTPTVIHLSEVADWPNPKALIENSLFKAVHPSPRVFMVLESTGNGNVGWWPDQWYWARDNFALGHSRLQPVFFPWFLADDLFPTDTWLKEHPVPHSWAPTLPLTERMIDKCVAYVRSTPLMRQLLGAGWVLPRHQSWFWEFNYLEHLGKRNAKGWLQEMSCDDVEALQPKKDLVFDLYAVEEQFKTRDTYSVWAITGEQILEKHMPPESDIDYDADRFRVTYHGVVHDVGGRRPRELIWEFVPLRAPVESANQFFDPDRKLLVWLWPEPGYDYTVAIDTASGGGGNLDNTVITVMRRSLTGREPDVQAAEFCSNHVSSAEAHAFALAICALYAEEMAEDPAAVAKEPMVACEQVRKPGDNVQLQMKLHGYRRMYKFARMDGRNPKRDKRRSHKEGWYTFSWSRDFMLDLFVHAVENGWYKLNSPFLLRHEIPAFQVGQTPAGKVRFEHEQGKHDDRIFAAAIAYVIANDTESASKRVERRFLPEPERLPAVDLAWVDSHAISGAVVAEGWDFGGGGR